MMETLKEETDRILTAMKPVLRDPVVDAAREGYIITHMAMFIEDCLRMKMPLVEMARESLNGCELMRIDREEVLSSVSRHLGRDVRPMLGVR